MSSSSGSTSTGTSRPASAIAAVSCVRPKRVWMQRSSSNPASWTASAAASASPCAVSTTLTAGSPLTRCVDIQLRLAVADEDEQAHGV